MLSEQANEERPFAFDFAITEQAKYWQELDAGTVEDVEEKRTQPQTSFFSFANLGDEYFSIADPASVKAKWLEDRREVKDSLRRTGKYFLWNTNKSQRK